MASKFGSSFLITLCLIGCASSETDNRIREARALDAKRQVNDNWRVICDKDRFTDACECKAISYGWELGNNFEKISERIVTLTIYYHGNHPILISGGIGYPDDTTDTLYRVDKNKHHRIGRHRRQLTGLINEIASGRVLIAKFPRILALPQDVIYQIEGYTEALDRIFQFNQSRCPKE